MNQRTAKIIALVGSILAGCQAKDSQKPADPKAVSACMAALHSHDDYFLVTKCEPLGPQRRFQGTWFVGFELSAFRRSYSGVPADLGTGPTGVDEIVVPASLSERIHARDSEGASAYQVMLLGRESSLAAMPGVKLVVADRVLSLQRVPISSSVTQPRG
jgi:hypothetical protein